MPQVSGSADGPWCAVVPGYRFSTAGAEFTPLGATRLTAIGDRREGDALCRHRADAADRRRLCGRGVARGIADRFAAWRYAAADDG